MRKQVGTSLLHCCRIPRCLGLEGAGRRTRAPSAPASEGWAAWWLACLGTRSTSLNGRIVALTVPTVASLWSHFDCIKAVIFKRLIDYLWIFKTKLFLVVCKRFFAILPHLSVPSPREPLVSPASCVALPGPRLHTALHTSHPAPTRPSLHLLCRSALFSGQLTVGFPFCIPCCRASAHLLLQTASLAKILHAAG